MEWINQRLGERADLLDKESKLTQAAPSAWSGLQESFRSAAQFYNNTANDNEYEAVVTIIDHQKFVFALMNRVRYGSPTPARAIRFQWIRNEHQIILERDGGKTERINMDLGSPAGDVRFIKPDIDPMTAPQFVQYCLDPILFPEFSRLVDSFLQLQPHPVNRYGLHL